MSLLVPCIWFDDQATEAADLYAHALPDTQVLSGSRFPETLDAPGGKERGSPMTVEVSVRGQPFTLLNGGPHFQPNPTLSFFVHLDRPEAVDGVVARLGEGGSLLMPLDTYPWSPRYAWVEDRYGVSWQIMASGGEGDGRVAPCLMFSGARQGLAEEALTTYARIFPEGRVTSVERYAKDEGPEGEVKHGRVSLAGQPLVAMDSHAANDLAFSEGVSLQVMCEDQAQVDRYWDALGEGGEPGRCGWLKDRFGVSWQVVPRALGGLLESHDAPARDRAFQAMLGMQKLDVAALQAAYDGSASRG